MGKARIRSAAVMALVAVVLPTQGRAEEPEADRTAVANRKPELIDPAQWLRFDLMNACAWGGCPSGRVTFALLINAQGRVTDCAVTRTSGSRRLDEVTCKTLLRYARFNPATDASGKPTAGRYASSVEWKVPDISEDAKAPTQNQGVPKAP